MDMKNALIDVICECPAIWDKGNRYHHNKYFLSKEWKKIANRFGLKVKNLRNTWKNLRQEFGKQLRKNEFLTDSQWPYFHKLMFLKDQFQTTVSKVQDMDTETTDNGDSDSENTRTSSASQKDAKIVTVNFEVPSTSEEMVEAHIKRRISPDPEVQLQEEGQNPWEGSNLEGRTLRAHDPHDEDIGFFNSLLSHVRRLRPREKLIFRLKVQQALLDLSFPEHARHRGSTFG